MHPHFLSYTPLHPIHTQELTYDAGTACLLQLGWNVATAHIRGGGEYGRQWHHDGVGVHKQQGVDDLQCCIQHVIDQGACGGWGWGWGCMCVYVSVHPLWVCATYIHRAVSTPHSTPSLPIYTFLYTHFCTLFVHTTYAGYAQGGKVALQGMSGGGLVIGALLNQYVLWCVCV